MVKKQMTPKQAIDAALEEYRREPGDWTSRKDPKMANSQRGLKSVRRRRKFRAPKENQVRRYVGKK